MKSLLAGKPFNNSDGFSWDASFSLAYNKNKLVQLPENLDELLIGNRKLRLDILSMSSGFIRMREFTLVMLKCQRLMAKNFL